MSTDKALEQAISRRLLEDPQLSAFDIQVDVGSAVVTLAGVVPNARAKLAILELALAVPGCQSVINDLVICPAGGLSDAAITATIRTLIDQHLELMKGAITVSVVGGVVTLSGAVGSPEEYALAGDVARCARGVRSVHNLLIIDKEAQSDDEALQMEIQAALKSVGELEWTEVEVAVSGDLIVLSGSVTTPRQRELATEVVRGVRAWHVRNEIVVAH